MATPFNLAGTASGTASGGTDWSWLAPLLSGIGGIATSGLDMRTGREAAGMADPFSGERGAYQGQLRDYMGANPVNPTAVTSGTNSALASLMRILQNPAAISDMPEYKAGLGFGTEAVNRGAGASGLLNSGNRVAALDKYGQDYGMNFLHQIIGDLTSGVTSNINAADLGLRAQGQGEGQLARLSGADTGNPAAAAQALLNGRGQQATSIGSGIGAIANGIGGGLVALQRILQGGSGGGFNVPGGVSGTGTGGDWGTDLTGAGTGGDWGTDLLGAGTGGDWGSDFLDLGQFL